MADPTVTLIGSGAASTGASSHPVTFTAQPAGTLLLLAMTAEAYPSGDPAGWTRIQWVNSTQWMGVAMWWRRSTGAESSATIALTGSGRCSWQVLAATDIAAAGSPLDVSAVGVSATAPPNSTYAGPSITPTAGRRLVVAVAHRIANATTTGATWTNSLTTVGATSATLGDCPAVVTAQRVLDGGAAVSTSQTFAPVATPWQMAQIIAAFKVAEAGGATHQASGAVAGSSATSGSLTVRLVAAGLIAAVSSVLGAASRVPAVHAAGGTVAATSAVSGTASRLAVTYAASGVVTATSAVSGAAARVPQILATSGSVGVVSTTSGAPTVRLAVGGAATATATAAGDPTVLHHITGSIPATSGTAGSAALVGGPQTHPATGVAPAVSSASGAVTARLAAAGSATAMSTAAGDATLIVGPQVRPTSGAVTAVSATFGTVDVLAGPQTWSAAGTIAAQATTAGVATLTARTSGAVAAVSIVYGSVINTATPMRDLHIAVMFTPDRIAAAFAPDRITAALTPDRLAVTLED